MAAAPLDRIVARLDQALSAHGLSDRAASLKAGLKQDAIRTIRNGHAPRIDVMLGLARVLDVPVSWLLGEDDDELPAVPSQDDAPDGIRIDDYVPIRSALAHFGAGGGGLDDAEGDGLGAPALYPRQLIERELRGDPADFVVADVEGQSMEPVLMSGDRVLIDRRKTNPSQAGLFALWDGYGLVIKWLDRVRDGSDPPRLRVLSENDRFPPYEITLDEASILGRVVWFARRL